MKILIIRLDAIGDYVLFRNFLEVLHKHPNYRKAHITLIGNCLWKDLVTQYDLPFIDKFICIDRNKFSQNRFYRRLFFWKISRKRYDIILNPTFSRNFFFDDAIIKHIKSKQKIAVLGDDSNMKHDLIKKSNSYYTKLIQLPNNLQFEFDKNKFFFQKILDQAIELKKPFFPIKNEEQENCIVFFPSASENHKQWDSQKFAELVKKILTSYDTKIYILGSEKDKELANIILKEVNNNKVNDFTGKTNLVELVEFIQKAKFLISNDTVAIHIAAAVDTSTICLYKGDHFGRFQPYPKYISEKILTIFTPELEKELTENNFNRVKYHSISKEDINTIPVDLVFQKFVNLFENIKLNDSL